MSFRGTRFYEELAVRNNAIARLFPQAFRNSKSDVSSFPPPESSNKNDLLFKVKAYEQPDSLKNWRLETMLSQDCSIGCREIPKWYVQSKNNAIARLFPRLSRDLKITFPVFLHPSPTTCYEKWSWAAGLASKWRVQSSKVKSTNNESLQAARLTKKLRKNAIARLFPHLAGPKAQLHKDKSNAPTSTSPMLRHPSPETIMISY